MNSSFGLRFVALVLLVLILSSCAGGDQTDRPAVSKSPEQASAPLDPPEQTPAQENPREEVWEPSEVVLNGVSEEGLNPTGPSLEFMLKNSAFATNAGDTKLTINGTPVDPALMQVNPNQILIWPKLAEGRNDLVFEAYDTDGRPLHMEKTIWAGSNKLQVDVVNEDGTVAAGSIKLRLKLVDNQEIVEELSSTNGRAEFINVPSRTVIVEAQSSDNSMGDMAAEGTDGHMTLGLVKFDEPSAIDNNDFSQGLAGWIYGTNAVTLEPHVEEIGPHSGEADTDAIETGGIRIGRSAPVTRAAQTPGTTMDAVLTTAGNKPQTLKRAFTIKSGTGSVTVRYRFVTASGSDGDEGTSGADPQAEYNFFYSVTARNGSGEAGVEQNTNNGLGHAAFDEGGSTVWKTIRLRTKREGDTVQVVMKAGRKAGCLLDGKLIVDVVLEKDEVTPSLAWDPEKGGLKVGYEVGKKALPKPVNIDVYWATGAAYVNHIGSAIKTIVVPAGSPAGAVGSENIPGTLLHDDPKGAKYLIAVISEDSVGPVPDVKIRYDSVANPAAVSAEMRDAVMDGLRSAGTKRGRISRTAVGPADQARAMFQNLTKSPGPMSSNIAYQISKYGAEGDAVVRVFEKQTKDMTLEQAIASAETIEAEMLKEINTQGPSIVSHHCADPSKISVVDVPLSNFTSEAAKKLFGGVAYARSFVREENHVFHMEIQKK